ncbi:uncharacterized protein LOC143276161 [Babylonia areolata]|uniref:uncharacterized protein LOC143276161 n=1 Tax=Babylonia areolata TaxID=304850 RepID=UPI003FD5F005
MPSASSPKETQPETPDDVLRSLLAAIRADRETEVRQLLPVWRQKGDHRHNNNNSLAPFMAAVKGGHPQILRCLLRHEVMPFVQSPLFLAIEEVSALEVVLAEGYSVHVTSSTTGKTPLQTAVTRNPAALPALLRAGCDVTARDPVRGNTALHTACAQHEESALLPLVQGGAWLNAVNHRGETPLHCLLLHAAARSPLQDFHAKSRRSLARCLIHMGCRVVVTTTTTTSTSTLTSTSTSSTTTTTSTSSMTSTSTTSRGYGVVTGGGDSLRVVSASAASAGGRGPSGSSCRRPNYKVARLYQQLVKETRRCWTRWTLQHLCRLTVRRVLEDAGRRREEEEEGETPRDYGKEEGDSKPGNWKGVGGVGGGGGATMVKMVEGLGLPCVSKDYLLYKHHVLDKEAFARQRSLVSVVKRGVDGDIDVVGEFVTSRF